MSKDLQQPAEPSFSTTEADGARKLVDDMQHTQAELVKSGGASGEMYDFALVGYLTLDYNETILQANHTAAVMFGVDRDKLLNCKFSTLVQDNVRNDWQGIRDQALAKGAKQAAEVVLRKADGTFFTTKIECRPRPGAAAGKWDCLIVLLDITRQKEVEEAVQLMTQFPDESNSPVLRIAAAGQLLYSNDSAQEWLAALGWKAGEPLPAPLLAVAANAAKQGYAVETEISTADGRTSLFFAVRPPDEDSINLYGLEITESKRAWQFIHKLNAMLEQRVSERTSDLHDSYAELESFTYSVSHDLRAPLRHIISFLDLLKEKLPAELDPKAKGYLQDISTASKRMGILIDKLLAFSQISREGLKTEPVDLAQIVKEILNDLKPDTAERSIKWKLAALPEVHGDAVMLRQVLSNLIENALKFTRTRDQAEIEIGCREDPDLWTIFIRDNGVGFNPADAGKLFGMFQRLHNQTEFEGVGVGLAIVRRIIQRHGGRTWAEGDADKGATFYFTLPRRRV
jgi:PAS domain S-box-containing protein